MEERESERVQERGKRGNAAVCRVLFACHSARCILHEKIKFLVITIEVAVIDSPLLE